MKKKIIIKIIIFTILAIMLGLTITLLFLSPSINLKGGKEVKVSLNEQFVDPGYKAKVMGKDITKKVKVVGKVNTNKLGSYKVTYMVRKNYLKTVVIREVKVIDDIKPVIDLVSGTEVKVCPNVEYIEHGYKATDNYDGDITAKVQIKKENNQIIYTVEDSFKNQVSVTRNITIIDDEKPVISLNGNATLYLIKYHKYVEKGYTAIDNCSGDLSNKVQVTNNINTSVIGTYKVTYSVKDEAGNEAIVTRTVKVTEQPQHNGSTIYLTFDDGPSGITPQVLNILKEEGVKATFFVLNHGSSYDYLLRRIVDEGHTIALHGNSHDYYSVYKSVDTYLADLTAIREKVKNVTGVDSTIMRFIGGSSNTVSRFSPGIMSTLTAEVTNRGYRYYDWNVSSSDTVNISSTQLYNNVINGLGSSSTYIVLMHDFAGNNKTVAALREIIRYGKNAGYNFDRITESTPVVHHKINN